MNRLLTMILVMLLLTSMAAILPASQVTSNADQDDTVYDYEVPILNQFDYVNIGNSACAPTSLTMLLRYYYPASGLDVPEVYNAGTQGYGYNGPAIGYENVSFQSPDQGLDIVDEEFRKYYIKQIDTNGDGILDWYSGLRSPASAAEYLSLVWGGASQATVSGYQEWQVVVNEIKERPLILNILYEGQRDSGHYVVLRGYSDSGTPDNHEDDVFYVNDPAYGQDNRKFTFGQLFGERSWVDNKTNTGWWKGRMITFEPILTERQRECTVVVDNSNILLDAIDARDANEDFIWQEYYGPGNWYYPEEGGHWAKWVPNLSEEGNYEIHVIFRKDTEQTDVTYTIYAPDNSKLGQKAVDQKGTGWIDENLGTFALKKGSYVKVDNVPAKCNVDAIRFEYVVKGIDVSHHQNDKGTIDWQQVKNAMYDFAFIKATGGTTFTDDYFTANMDDASSAKLLVGAYHFAYPEYNDAVSEAEHFISVAGDYLKPGYLRPALDLEDDPDNDSYPHRMGKESLSNWIDLWMATVKNQTGVEPILYTGWHAREGDCLEASIADYDVWIAHCICDRHLPPDIGIWDAWDFWQYYDPLHCTGNPVPGITGGVDLNLFKGSLADLQEYVIGGNTGGTVDVVLIIDDSGSMSSNDPTYMRRQAAGVFIDAMQDNDRIGIVEFDGSATTLWPIQMLGAERTQIKNSLNSLSPYDGTSLSAGLSAGYQQLLTVESSGNDKAAVFLTDGYGSYSNEAQLYAAKGWPIYVLGLGSGTNEILLQQIADDSGGEYQRLDDATQMQGVYNKIATIISGGTMILDLLAHLDLGVTLEFETALTTDAVIGNFFVGWDGSTVDLSLITPDGASIGPDTSDPNVYHSKSSTYELYRISSPLPGIWTLVVFGSDLPPGGEDIVVQVSEIPNIPTQGNPPVADAGPDQTVFAIPPATTAMVTLDGSGSYDPDGDPLTYNWTWDSNTASGVNPTVELPLGTTTITLVVNDGKVDSAPDALNVTVLLQATVDFDPDVFNLRSRGKVVTAYAELPEGFDVSQVDISSIRLNGTIPALAKPTSVGDHDKDGIPDLMVKFDASAVKSLLTPGDEVEITISGEVAGIPFEGTDTIRVINP